MVHVRWQSKRRCIHAFSRVLIVQSIFFFIDKRLAPQLKTPLDWQKQNCLFQTYFITLAGSSSSATPNKKQHITHNSFLFYSWIDFRKNQVTPVNPGHWIPSHVNGFIAICRFLSSVVIARSSNDSLRCFHQIPAVWHLDISITCICSGVSCTLARSFSSVTLSCRASRLCSLFSSSACVVVTSHTHNGPLRLHSRHRFHNLSHVTSTALWPERRRDGLQSSPYRRGWWCCRWGQRWSRRSTGLCPAPSTWGRPTALRNNPASPCWFGFSLKPEGGRRREQQPIIYYLRATWISRNFSIFMPGFGLPQQRVGWFTRRWKENKA